MNLAGHRFTASAFAALLAVGTLLATPMTTEASVVIQGRAFDGEKSAQTVREAFRANRPTASEGIKVALAETEIAIELIPTGGPASSETRKPVSSWSVKTDANGAFALDLGRDSFPPDHSLVASIVRDGSRWYSPFLVPRADAKPLQVHLYPTTENPSNLRGELKVVHDIQKEGDKSWLRVRVGLMAQNVGGDMYVGRRAGSLEREIWRLPFPAGARLVRNKVPDEGSPGWRISLDGRWLILDTPIPGICDLEEQGNWEAEYLVSARQNLVLSYPVGFTLGPQQATAWCIGGEMKLFSSLLPNPPEESRGTGFRIQDPFTGEERQFEIIFSNEGIQGGETLRLALTVDNAAVGQVSERAVKLVGGFLLLLVLAAIVGIVFGPRSRSGELAAEEEGIEEVLDRIADLDRRLEGGRMKEAEHRKLRAPLVELALGKLPREAPAAAVPGGLPAAATQILARIDALDPRDPAAIAERAHLLEALAKTLPRG